jgi:hypothetical protein
MERTLNAATQAILEAIEQAGGSLWRDRTKHLYMALNLEEAHVVLLALGSGNAEFGWKTLPKDHLERKAYESLLRKLDADEDEAA